MKTIREISESTGISKVSLYKLIKKPELKDHIQKDGNTTLIDDIGQQIIIEYYSRQRLASLNDILDESTEKSQELEENEELNHVNKDGLQEVNDVKNPDIIRILENQVNTKDEQIKEKDNQIQTKDEQIRQKDNQLNALLILLREEKNNVKLISDSSIIPSQPNTYSEPIEPQPKRTKGFFSKIFKKR